MAARFVVTGTVQGVFFRASTRAQAMALGIDGHARNCEDGSVEVIAGGSPEAIEQLAAWLQHGPRQAVVEDVSRTDWPEQQVATGFAVQ